MELKVLQRNFYDLKTGSGSTFGCTLYTLKSWIQTEIRSGSSTLNFQCSTVKIHSIDCVNICSSHNWLVRWVEAINYKTISTYRLQLLTTFCPFWGFLNFPCDTSGVTVCMYWRFCWMIFNFVSAFIKYSVNLKRKTDDDRCGDVVSQFGFFTQDF